MHFKCCYYISCLCSLENDDYYAYVIIAYDLVRINEVCIVIVSLLSCWYCIGFNILGYIFTGT